MKTLIVFNFLVACVLALPDLSKWNEWKKLHGRTYAAEEELFRQKTFFRNLKIIELHNKKADAGIVTFRLALNKFADLTNSEFAAKVNDVKYNPYLNETRNYHNLNVSGNVPDSIDWRTKGVVAPIKEQGKCKSSWAFSAIASLESVYALVNGKLNVLSEQNAIDCSNITGNWGCEGGSTGRTFEYIIQNNGIDTDESYPYEGIDDKCRFKKENVGATLIRYKFLRGGDEDELKASTALVGPISAAVDASSSAFQFYSSGVYIDDQCSDFWVGHGVTVVGYDTLNGQDYWTVRNSWGTDWGLNGYILMARNRRNMCGIATLASYPIVAKN